MNKLDIINRALLKVGLPLAAAINDCDWNASLVFDAVAQECMRGFTWNFATVFKALVQAEAPGFGYEKGYVVPADCVRIVDVHCAHDLRSPRARYHVTGKKLFTQVAPCYLRYVSNAVPCEDWPPDFCNVVAARIACEIAPLSAQTMNMTPQLLQGYGLALAEAQATDARESSERVPFDHNILAARVGYENVGRRT